MVWLPRNAQKCIFFTPFSPFLAKKNFFSKIRLRQFFGTIESYLDAKNQKKLWSGSSGIHPDGRTDRRTYESKTIGPPKFLGRSKKRYDIAKAHTGFVFKGLLSGTWDFLDRNCYAYRCTEVTERDKLRNDKLH